MTNEIHRTLTEWKPFPYIFPIRTTVRIGRGQEAWIGSSRTKKLRGKNPQKSKETRKKTLFRLSILIDKPTLFINSWLIRLSVDNVLLINTRSLSIVIDKPIPLSIGISTGRSCRRRWCWGRRRIARWHRGRRCLLPTAPRYRRCRAPPQHRRGRQCGGT